MLMLKRIGARVEPCGSHVGSRLVQFGRCGSITGSSLERSRRAREGSVARTAVIYIGR